MCLQDKNPDNRAAAEAKFKDISEAYEVLVHQLAICANIEMGTTNRSVMICILACCSSQHQLVSDW